MVHLRWGVTALLFIGAPAYAQSLENGEPLQFGHAYQCNNERMFVSNCRDKNPASYCMVQYPDRPKHNGFTIQKAVQLGEVLKTLSACSEGGTASAATPHVTPAAKPVRTAGERPVQAPASKDGQAYLTCVTNDPEWQPPLTIIMDERSGDVRVAGATSSGSSPNPRFNPTTVDFGFAGRIWSVNRVDLSLSTTDTFDTWHGTCKFGAPPKRAF